MGETHSGGPFFVYHTCGMCEKFLPIVLFFNGFIYSRIQQINRLHLDTFDDKLSVSRDLRCGAIFLNPYGVAHNAVAHLAHIRTMFTNSYDVAVG